MRTIYRFLGLSLLTAVSLSATSVAHGTAAAVIVSPLTLVAAIDSKEVNRQYLSDGTLLTEDRISCKVREAGPFYVAMVGISRADGGFDTLRESVEAYRAGDTLDAFALRLMTAIPHRLASALTGVRNADRAWFDLSFRDREVLQLTLLGVEDGKPRVVIVTFRSGQSDSLGVAVTADRASCPGDCDDPRTVYLLGIRGDAENFLAYHPEIAGDTRTERALELIRFAYTSHPEVVGGPATVIRVTEGGVVMAQRGACADQRVLPLLEIQLDRAIQQIANITVREDVAQYSKKHDVLRSKAIHAQVSVVDGAEVYAWSNPGARLPEPWCGGELATMLRVTRNILGRAGAFVTAEDRAIVMTFHAAANDRIWQIVSGGRTYPLAFEGRAWFSQATGQLMRIRWEASDQQFSERTGITRVEWDETFSPTDIAGRPVLVPEKALYVVRYAAEKNRSEWTETRFSDFRRFGSTQTVEFEQLASR